MTKKATPQKRDPRFLLSVGLAVLCLAVYGLCLRNGFINYDDNEYVYENPMVSPGLSWYGLNWAFSFHAYNWHPLTWMTHMLDCQIYGLHPWGHHLTNVLLHAATVVLLFRLLVNWTGDLWRSVLLAALFGLHPLRVESVAWVAERKDVLSGLFFVLTLWAYGDWIRKGGGWRYRLALLWYALGLMSKPMLVTLPMILFLVERWPLRRTVTWARSIVEKLPFAVMAAGASAATIFAQRGVIQPIAAMPFATRVANALVTCAVYLRQTVWPFRLGLFYPYPIEGIALGELVIAGVVVVGISCIVMWQRKERPYLWVGWVWYLTMLTPVLGLLQVGGQAHADRYTYLPIIGILLMLCWSVRLQSCLGIAVIALSVATIHQELFWRDSETIWRHTLAVTQRNEVAHYQLGDALRTAGHQNEAAVEYRAGIAIKSAYPEAHNNLGLSLAAKGDQTGAESEFREALRVDPNYAPALYNLGSALLENGQPENAIVLLEHSAREAPDFQATLYKLGLAYARRGRVQNAISQLQQFTSANPGAPQGWLALGNSWMQAGQLTEAVRSFEKSVKLQPSAPAELNLGICLLQTGAAAGSIPHFQKAAQLQPNSEAAYFDLGNAELQLDNKHAARDAFASALKIQPRNIEALASLAWLLATSSDPALQNPAQALALATQANDLSHGTNVMVLRTLAAAHAANRQFPAAIASARQAADRAKLSNMLELIPTIEKERQDYEAGRIFVEP